MKNILKTIIIVVLIYATFILIESMRLENNHTEEPLITLKKEEIKQDAELETDYISLGFTLKKYTYNDIPMRGSFVLFDTFTIWEWVQW